ncbi:oligosaccharyl transferase subunit [Rhizophagus clarus]|uniref:Oligosaccharyl transferase subunit n=1 Tax=Rhizophagus clarus TaxID=94130 RepID=A0A8H3KUZ1_9GLOM|nr:oligosaccharyl transferase subunit [Rhizophagus clarus]
MEKFFRAFLFVLIFSLLTSHASAAKPSLETKLHKLNEATRKNQALDPQINCVPCKDFDPEFRLVAKSWLGSGNILSRIYFGVLDFKNGREIYAKLNLNNAPTLFYFPPTTGQYAKEVSEPDRYDFNRRGFSADSFASFLSHHLGTQVPVNRPLNYFAIFITIFFILAGLAMLKLMFSIIQNLIQNKSIWTAFSLITIFIMISGHMWNHIRSPPYIIPQNGKISYITPGFSSQLGIESQIVAVLYCICSFSVVTLIISIPKIEDKTKQRFGVYIWMGVLVATFSLLFALFRQKNPGYPFRLFI